MHFGTVNPDDSPFHTDWYPIDRSQILLGHCPVKVEQLSSLPLEVLRLKEWGIARLTATSS
jgi:hypothetical protein